MVLRGRFMWERELNKEVMESPMTRLSTMRGVFFLPMLVVLSVCGSQNLLLLLVD